MHHTMSVDEARTRVETMIARAGHFGPFKTRVWTFDAEEHHFSHKGANAPGTPVARFRKLGGDLSSRILVAAVWPGPLGVVYAWPAWRGQRIRELSQHIDRQRATQIVSGIVKSARRMDLRGALGGVADYHAVFEEVRERAELYARLCEFVLVDGEDLSATLSQPVAR